MAARNWWLGYVSVLGMALSTGWGCAVLGGEIAPVVGSDAVQEVESPPDREAEEVVVLYEKIIDAPVIAQKPELLYGCEVTSLAMLTKFLGLPETKMDLAERLAKDPTPQKLGAKGGVATWGDPERGFVGNVSGPTGYGVYHKPIADLLSSVYQPGAEDLSGSDFFEVKKAISQGKPVVVWATIDFRPTDLWVTWQTPEGKEIRITYMEHAVLLVGYDREYVYVNNPATGEKAQRVELRPFLQSWEQLGKQAVTFK